MLVDRLGQQSELGLIRQLDGRAQVSASDSLDAGAQGADGTEKDRHQKERGGESCQQKGGKDERLLLPDLIDGLLDVRSIHAHERGSEDAPVGVEYGGRNQENCSIALKRFVSPSRCWERDTPKSIGPREPGADAPNVRMPLDD